MKLERLELRSLTRRRTVIIRISSLLALLLGGGFVGLAIYLGNHIPGFSNTLFVACYANGDAHVHQTLGQHDKSPAWVPGNFLSITLGFGTLAYSQAKAIGRRVVSLMCALYSQSRQMLRGTSLSAKAVSSSLSP